MRKQSKNIFEFWGIKDPSPIDHTVRVHIDTSRITLANSKAVAKASNLQIDTEKEREAMGFRGKQSLNEQGLNSSLRKTKRQALLSNLISLGKIKTMREAMTVPLDAEIDPNEYTLPKTITANMMSYGVIESYLHAIGKQLLDDELNKMIGAKEPVIYDQSGRIVKQKYAYYDGDPLKGGKKISRGAYQKLLANVAKQIERGEFA